MLTSGWVFTGRLGGSLSLKTESLGGMLASVGWKLDVPAIGLGQYHWNIIPSGRTYSRMHGGFGVNSNVGNDREHRSPCTALAIINYLRSSQTDLLHMI
jgi:hypothetical protein